MRHLHIENSSRSSALSHVKPADIEAARARHPREFSRLNVTIGWDGDILESALATAEFMIASRPPREDLDRRAPKLRWIQTTGAGVDHLFPFDWLPARIVLTNNSGPHGPKCEDFCTMALLALWMRMPAFATQQAARAWNSIFTMPIAGRTAVVFGYGDLGQAAVRAAKKLQLNVVAVTRSGNGTGPADRVIASGDIEQVLPRADFLVVTTPLTTQTRGFFDARRLGLLPRHAGVLNVARAPIVDYMALARMLNDGSLSGAILDVHDPEPLPAQSPLWSTPNLIVTPHVSSDDPRYVEMLLDAWVANLRRLDAGRGLNNVVDRVHGY